MTNDDTFTDHVVNYSILYNLNVLAQKVANTTFAYFMAVTLVAIQHISKIDLEASFGDVNGTITSFANENGTFLTLINEENMTTIPLKNLTYSFVLDEQTITPFCFTSGAAAYGAFICLIVFVSAHRNPGSDFDGGTITKLYDWTDTIPIIDSLLEIPIAFANDFWGSLFLWTGYGIACTALFLGLFWKGNYEATEEAIGNIFKTDFESGSDDIILLCTNIYSAYLLLRVTSDSSQYFVLRKAQKNYDEKDKEN